MHVQKACKAANKFSFIFAGSIERARRALSNGYDSVTYGTDASVLTEAYRTAVRQILG